MRCCNCCYCSCIVVAAIVGFIGAALAATIAAVIAVTAVSAATDKNILYYCFVSDCLSRGVFSLFYLIAPDSHSLATPSHQSPYI